MLVTRLRLVTHCLAGSVNARSRVVPMRGGASEAVRDQAEPGHEIENKGLRPALGEFDKR